MAAPIDFPIALSILFPGENVHPRVHEVGITYAQLNDGKWRGSTAIPMLAAIQTAWTNYLVAHPEYGLAGAALDRFNNKSLLDTPNGLARLLVAIKRLDYADLTTMIPAYKTKYPTLAAYVTAVKAQVDLT